VVGYRREPALDMLVPGTLHETYMAVTPNDSSGQLGPVSERIECEARYSHVRRFEAAARIVP
jgi:hypothetical protein